jgi:hypothetical protein
MTSTTRVTKKRTWDYPWYTLKVTIPREGEWTIIGVSPLDPRPSVPGRNTHRSVRSDSQFYTSRCASILMPIYPIDLRKFDACTVGCPTYTACIAYWRTPDSSRTSDYIQPYWRAQSARGHGIDHPDLPGARGAQSALNDHSEQPALPLGVPPVEHPASLYAIGRTSYGNDWSGAPRAPVHLWLWAGRFPQNAATEFCGSVFCLKEAGHCPKEAGDNWPVLLAMACFFCNGLGPVWASATLGQHQDP